MTVDIEMEATNLTPHNPPPSTPPLIPQPCRALDAHSHFSSLFQWYSPLVPYFEAFHMLRKAGLIAAGTVFGSPTTQSVIYLIINISFLILLRVLKPLVFFPCSIFKGKNLFLLAEMLGCTISIIGNLLALIGSFSQEAVNFVGVTFASVNGCFAILFIFGFGKDMKRTAKTTIANSISGDNKAEDDKMITRYRTDSLRLAIGKSVNEHLEEWETVLDMIQNVDDKAKAKLIEGLPFIHSQVTSAIKVSAQAM
jgi:hypothetical protein